jgi:hypothetical protein
MRYLTTPDVTGKSQETDRFIDNLRVLKGVRSVAHNISARRLELCFKHEDHGPSMHDGEKIYLESGAELQVYPSGWISGGTERGVWDRSVERADAEATRSQVGGDHYKDMEIHYAEGRQGPFMVEVKRCIPESDVWVGDADQVFLGFDNAVLFSVVEGDTLKVRGRHVRLLRAGSIVGQWDRGPYQDTNPVPLNPVPDESASHSQVGGDHYKDMEIQPAAFCELNKLSLLESNVVKRMCRWKKKGNPLEDLLKAKHEIDLLIEIHNVK